MKHFPNILVRAVNRISHLSSGWGFTSGERRAMLVLVLLIISGSSYRYWQRQKVAGDLVLITKQDTTYSPELLGNTFLPRLLDLNKATIDEFEQLPGIGPVKAQRIIELRNKQGSFKSIDDLQEVKGIGKKTIERLRPYVNISAP